MRRILSLIFLLGLIPPLAWSAGDLRVWGQVRDAAGGVPGALVIVAGRDSCLSDASGNYSFAQVPMGPCAIRVTAPGREALCLRLWLRREAFLPLELHQPRQLALGIPEDSLRLYDPYPRDGLADLDGDGRPDACGWRPLTSPHQELLNGLPCQDPWGGVWESGDDPDADLQPAAGQGLGAQQLAYPAFFSAGLSQGIRVRETPLVGSPDLWVAGSGSDVATGGFQWGRDLGPWHHLWASGRLARGTPARRSGDDRSTLSATLGHQWLLAPRLTLEQRLQGNRTRRLGLETDNPGLWLHLPSMSEWRDARLDQDQFSWQGLARWSPSEQLRADLLSWVRQRSQDSDGREYDRLRNRLLPTGLPDSLTWGWFPTQRSERRTAWGGRAALEQRHERGQLQGAIELERQRREQDASLDSTIWQPSGIPDWLSQREQVTFLSGRLLDRFQASSTLAFEACLDLRYAYHELVRRQVGLFQRNDVPEVAFNQDLLSLEPRLALRLGAQGRESEIYFQRRQFLASPASRWDMGRSPEALWDTPLLVAVGSDQILEALLPATQVDQVGDWSLARLGPVESRLGVWGQRWRDLPLAWWTRTERSVDVGQLIQAMDARQTGVDLRLENARGNWSWSIQGAWRRAWLNGLQWQPLADTTFWVGRARSLRRLPGVPDWSAAAELSTSGAGRWLRFDPLLRLRWQGARDMENAPGLAQLPALLCLDAALDCRLPRWPAWTLTVTARNLLDDPTPESARLAWDPVDLRSRRVEAPGAGRVLGLRLAWSPRP